MDGPSRPSRTGAMAAAASRAAGRGLWQAARYLGPLSLDAASYAWRLGADGIDGIRGRVLRRQALGAPERSAHFAEADARLRVARTARWASWHALPAGRRIAVRTATAAFGLAIFLLVRSRTPESMPPDAGAANADIRTTRESPVVVSQPAFDLERAAARFKGELITAVPGTWKFLTDGPVLAHGNPGEWDDFTVASPWVLRESAGGTARYRLWYRGCRATGRDRRCAIGHATSPDGVRWTKTARAVFEPPGAAERRQLHGVTVVRRSDGYLLWYSVTPELFDKGKGSTLHLATSNDGVRWEAAGEVAKASEELPYPIEPSVLEAAGTLHLWFVDSLRHLERDNYAEHEGAPYLRHLTSSDGRQWHEAGSYPLGPSGLGRIRVTVEASSTGFNATAFASLDERWARLTSTDGNDWVVDPASVTRLDRASGGLAEVGGRITGATALADDGGTFAWFVTSRPGGREEIRAGFRKES